MGCACQSRREAGVATFDYTPVAGVYPLWGLRVEDKDGEASPDGPVIGCFKLGEVEAEIEQQVVEHQIGPDNVATTARAAENLQFGAMKRDGADDPRWRVARFGAQD